MRLGLDDLTDATRADAVLSRQLDFVPRSAAQIIQPKGTLAGADEHIPPLLCVVHRVLQHKPCRHTEQPEVNEGSFHELPEVTMFAHQVATVSLK